MKKFKLSLILFILSVLVPSCQKDDDIFNPEIQYGSVTDFDKNTYRTVTIGEQVWMAENLKTSTYSDGTPIPYGGEPGQWSGSPGTYCWYDNKAKNGDSGYGAFYNWSAVNTGRLCPAGWHVPAIGEWKNLENYLIANGYNFDGTRIENKIARSLASGSEWESNELAGSPGNNPSTSNGSGFSALPSGFRDPAHGWDEFKGKGTTCGWWTSTSWGEGYALHTSMNINYPYLHTDDPEQLITIIWSYGFSVRCVRD